jgi:4-hydroxyphenylacetate 3-monooxygenase
LRDDRAVYVDGERVRDVTAHEAFRNSASSIARLYDALHDPVTSRTLLRQSDVVPGLWTHRNFVLANDAEDLKAIREATACWSRMSYGWMGRTPDYKAALMTTLAGAQEFYGEHAPNAQRWYRFAQERLPYISHALANPPVDRHEEVASLKDVCVHVTRESSDGVRVTGAKVVATNAPLTEWCFVGQTPGTATDDPSMAVCFFVPIAAPGVTLICRSSFEQAAARSRSVLEHPLSSRFDENDAILVLNDVFIPWDDVLVYRSPQRVREFFSATGFVNNFLFHGCTRLAVKLDFLAGLLARALRATGGSEIRGKKAALGEVVALRHAFWSLSAAMAASPERGRSAGVLPARQAAMAYCVLAPDLYPRVRDIVQTTIASALVYLPASERDLAMTELEPLLRRFVRGSQGVSHVERIKILKLLWDATCSEFGSRHELYERNYAGGWECIRLMVAGDARRSGDLAAMEALADQCLSEMDAEGFERGGWCVPGSAA